MNYEVQIYWMQFMESTCKMLKPPQSDHHPVIEYDLWPMVVIPKIVNSHRKWFDCYEKMTHSQSFSRSYIRSFGRSFVRLHTESVLCNTTEWVLAWFFFLEKVNIYIYSALCIRVCAFLSVILFFFHYLRCQFGCYTLLCTHNECQFCCLFTIFGYSFTF